MWSLAMEEQFYLLWPLLLLAGLRGGLSRRALLVGTACLAALVLFHRIDVWTSPQAGGVYSYPDTRVDALLIGCAAGFVWKLGWRPSRLLASGAFGLLVAVLFGFEIHSWNGPLHTWGFTAIGLLAAVCVLSASQFQWLEWMPLCYLGRISYALYLWHLPLLYLLRDGSPTHGSFLSGIMGVAIAVGAADMSWRWIERPFLRQSPVSPDQGVAVLAVGRRPAVNQPSGPAGTAAGGCSPPPGIRPPVRGTRRAERALPSVRSAGRRRPSC